AIKVLRVYRNNPDLYRSGPQLIGLPPLENLQELMNRNYSFEDALFALQCNDCNLRRALQWLTDGFPTEVLSEQEKAADKPQDGIPFELIEQMRLDNAENQNRMLDDDDDDDDDEDFVLKTAKLNLQNNVELTKVDTLTKDWSGVRTKIPLSETLLKMIVKSPPLPTEKARTISDVWALSINDRWRLYTSWVESFREVCEAKMSAIQQKYAAIVGRYNEIRTMKTMAVLKKARVLGMTTTGAAKHQAVLSAVKPKIAIIEEAAEVLESHIITSLSSSCEHLILIGDHFQLRPNPAVYQLAKHFNFDVSLFERLINNGFPHAVLTEQHRMRSEISDNLMPYFYTNLRNHRSVDEYENVKGMSKNMYFFNHGHLEDQDGDSTTRKNVFEAKMIVSFMRYLQQQGYKPDQITILCCYAGQMFFIRRMISDKYKLLGTDKMVRISVVDDYQGEESDIILLSFVRSNEDGKIGFLKTKNRVCVALSRAKIGLYCFGNFDHLAACSKELWADIVQNLKRLVPEGGCNKICEFRLNCGHSCTINCHTQNIDHTETK
uniref:NFX1-type zinc finger-containing protein 1 n=1 Tax=Romanomermis culicivorax TaxID=13658 RepID=A0A915JZM5_ROMCU